MALPCCRRSVLLSMLSLSILAALSLSAQRSRTQQQTVSEEGGTSPQHIALSKPAAEEGEPTTSISIVEATTTASEKGYHGNAFQCVADPSQDLVTVKSCAHKVQRRLQNMTSGEKRCVTAGNEKCQWLPNAKPSCGKFSRGSNSLCPPGANSFAECCVGRRFLFYGSSHLRVVALSMLALLKGIPVKDISERDRNVPSYNVEAGPGKITQCNSWKANPYPEDSCSKNWSRKYTEQHMMCRYPYDIGFHAQACGFPHMKRWDLSYSPEGCKVSHVSVAKGSTPVDAQSFPRPEKDVGRHFITIGYAFKSYVETEQADLHVLRHVADFSPDVLVLGYVLWGCQTEAKCHCVRDFGWGYDVPQKQCKQHYSDAIKRLDAGVDPKTLVVHFVETSNVWHTHKQHSEFILGALDELRQTSPRRAARHLIVDMQTILKKLPLSERDLHGYEGVATMAWAEALLGLVCGGDD